MKNKENSKKGDYKHTSKILNGVLFLTSKGVGYVRITDQDDDIEIQPEHINTALHRDEVEVEILPKKGDRVSGKITKILNRAKEQFVGTIDEEKGFFFLIPDDQKVPKDISLSKDSKDLRVGFKALVKITDWEKMEGTIVKVIGKKGDHNAEMESIVFEKGFETSFPSDVEKEAEEIQKTEKPLKEDEIAKRRDFRNTTTFTIDPKDAKDFDDAISIKKLSDDKFEIGVHIADVSYYVREGSKLDKEARSRALSVYLVDRTIPMLPEILSNDLCSLNPNEDRFSYSAVFEMDTKGNISTRWFGRTVIHSNKRFTYENAQKVLNDKSGDFFTELDTLNKIAGEMRKEKFRKGAIDFESDEVGFELDETGKPLKIYKKDRLDTHKLVEEFMLLANREVAEFFWKEHQKSKGNKVVSPFIYRIHDCPNEEKVENLATFVKALGFDLHIPQDGIITGKDLQSLFKQIEGSTSESLIKTASVRSMAKAIYSTSNVGHFGLAFEYYTHFTSPIRRYPDLIVHRLLERCLKNGPVGKNDFTILQKIAENSSKREIGAAEAERDSKKMKQVEYMAYMIGKEFDGTISGVTEWGIYVEEKDTRSEGMIKLRDMKDDNYILDEKNYAIIGERTKKKFSLGDSIRFKVVGADIEKKTLDYTLV